MTEEQLIGFIVQGGIGVIFGILYIRLWNDYKDLLSKYLEDLRDIAGIRQQLRQVQSTVQTWRGSSDMVDDTNSTRPLPDLRDNGGD